MTNNELTYFSAKAIGLRLNNAPTDYGAGIIRLDDGGGFWNPLQSGDDVVRLIAVLRVVVDCDTGTVWNWQHEDGVDIDWKSNQFHAASAAIRLAVTTLAARIGSEAP